MNNAIEFVRKYGLDRAKREISNEGTIMQCNNTDGIIDDLKQIVDAFELVEKLGGLEKCKGYVQVCFYKGRDHYGNRIKQAINLVEQCQ